MFMVQNGGQESPEDTQKALEDILRSEELEKAERRKALEDNIIEEVTNMWDEREKNEEPVGEPDDMQEEVSLLFEDMPVFTENSREVKNLGTPPVGGRQTRNSRDRQEIENTIQEENEDANETSDNDELDTGKEKITKKVAEQATKRISPSIKQHIELGTISNFTRLISKTAFLYKWYQKVKLKMLRRTDPNAKLGLLELVESFHIRRAQQDVYGEDIHRLKRKMNPPLAKNSSLRGLSPFLDKFGVLRVASRVGSFQTLSYNAKYPIILPKEHSFTEMVLEHSHILEHHLSGPTRMIGQIRTKYWIPCIKQKVKKYLKKNV
jgi:hypothetical protein